MKYFIAISGLVASGKSVLENEFIKQFKTHKIFTRQLLVDTGAENESDKLIEAGKRLDQEIYGAWVRDGILPYVSANEKTHKVILIDAVRTEAQIEHLRETYGERFVHLHVSVPYAVAKESHESRDHVGQRCVLRDGARRPYGEWRLVTPQDR